MEFQKVYPLKAQSLIYPVIRPLSGIFACLQTMRDSDLNQFPDAILQLMSHLFQYLSKSLEKLVSDANIQEDHIQPLLSDIQGMEQWNQENQDLIPRLNALNISLSDFCSCYKSELRSAYNSERDYYRTLFREMVEPPRVYLIYGKDDEKAAETIVTTLSDGCYYDVEPVSIVDFWKTPPDYDIHAFFSLNTTELFRFIDSDKNPMISLILMDLGREINKCKPGLFRTAYQIDTRKTKIIYRPFSTLRLLQEFERVYFHNLLLKIAPSPAADVGEMPVADKETG